MINNNEKPLVSIVTPLLKIDNYFNECVDSVLNQKDSNLEWLIISSKDVINKIVQSNIVSDKTNIKFIETKEKTSGFRRNIGIKNASGKYLLFLDSDDYFYDCFSINNLVKAIEKNHSKVVGASCVINDAIHGNIYRNDLIIKNGPQKINFLKFQNESGFFRFIYLTSFLKNKNLFSDLSRFQDSLFLVKTLINAQDFYVIPDIVYVYRKNHKQLAWSSDMYKDHLVGVFQVLELARCNKFRVLIRRMLRNIIITTSRRLPNKTERERNIIDINKHATKLLISNFYAFSVAPLLFIVAIYKLISIR